MREKGQRGFSLLSKISGRRLSYEQEVKSVHTTRAMRGYQNLRVSSNSKM